MSKKQLDQFNYFTGHKYSGQNAHDLASKGHKSNQWGTYNQWLNQEQQVQKGEHGTSIMFVKDDPDTGKRVAKWYRVFNLDQVAPLVQDKE